MAVIAFPSENAVGTLFGSQTKIVREQAMAMMAKCSTPSPLKAYVIAGFDVSAVPASNGVRLLTGSADYAIINGTMISFDATVTLTGLSNNTHFIYAQLTKVSSLVTTWALTSNTTGTPPSDSVALAQVVVAGGVAGTPVNAKKNPSPCFGTYTGNTTGTTPQDIYLGFKPTVVIVYGTQLNASAPGAGVAIHGGGSGSGKIVVWMNTGGTNVVNTNYGTGSSIGGDPLDFGFRVSNDTGGSTARLNYNAITYYYIAW